MAFSSLLAGSHVLREDIYLALAHSSTTTYLQREALLEMAHLQYFNDSDAGLAKERYGYSQAVRIGNTIECSGQGVSLAPFSLILTYQLKTQNQHNPRRPQQSHKHPPHQPPRRDRASLQERGNSAQIRRRHRMGTGVQSALVSLPAVRSGGVENYGGGTEEVVSGACAAVDLCWG